MIQDEIDRIKERLELGITLEAKANNEGRERDALMLKCGNISDKNMISSLERDLSKIT